MKLVILALDDKVAVDGEWRPVDCSSLRTEKISVVQWNANTGWIEHINSPFDPPSSWFPPVTIDSIDPFQDIIGAWYQVGPWDFVMQKPGANT